MRIPNLLLAFFLALPSGASGTIHLRSRDLDPRSEAVLADSPAILAVDGPVTASVRGDLTDLGVTIDAYVPDNALLVRIPAEVLPAVVARGYVAGLMPLSPEDKVAADIDQPAWPGEPALRGLLTVQLLPGIDATGFAAKDVAVVGRRAKGQFPRVVVAVPPGQERATALTLAARPDVLWIEPAGLVHWLNDTSIWVGQSWQTNLTPMFAAGLFGNGQIVGVSDTGLDADHACFYDAAQGLPSAAVNLLQRKVISYHDRVQDGNWDSFGHGTHVAGTIAGDLNRNGRWDLNGANQAPDGMAPAARLAISDARDTDLPGNPIDLVELFVETYNDGARLHSNSWASCGCNGYTVHAQDVDEFMWTHRDMLVVFAAGNSGPGANTALAPGVAKDCVTVGATARAGGADDLAGFSSRGPASDGRLKPTLSAPGVNIRSARGDSNINTFNDGVTSMSGTSMATPTTTGLATLLRQYLTDGYYPSGAARAADAIAMPSSALMRAMLVNSARNMVNQVAAPSNEQGWGRVLLDDVLYLAGDTRRLWLMDDTRGLAAPGEARTFPLLVGPAVGELKVTLTWTDPPSATLVNPNLVNDLDLVVAGPGGSFLGNVFAGAVSQTGGAADRLNVIEGVRLVNPTSGVWTVTVVAANIPFGPQPYAVVATGDVRPAPHASHRSHTLQDPSGDGDSSAEPGELVELGLTLGEDAGSPATGISVELIPLVPWATVIAPSIRSLPDLAANGTTSSTSPWLVAIDPDAPCGEPMPFRLVITTTQGVFEDGFVQPTGGDIRSVSTVLIDGFDSISNGAPPDSSSWTIGFNIPPGPGIALRVAADSTVQPSGTAPASPPHALYVGRSGSNSLTSESQLASRPLDLSTYAAATLTFKYWVRQLEGDIPARDVLSVEASGDGGATFPFLLYQNPDYISGMDSSSYPDRRWHAVTLDLGRVGLLRSGVLVRFRVRVNADEPDDAVYLDDVRIEASTVTCNPGCIPPAFTPIASSPVCVATPTDLSATVLAGGFGPFDGNWDFGDATGQSVSPLDQVVSHSWAVGGTYTASLTTTSASTPTCARTADILVEVDAAPVLRIDVPRPICIDDPSVSFTAGILVPGVGPMIYTWDFGDLTPPVIVADPTQPVSHIYAATVAFYLVTLTAESARVPGCSRVAQTSIFIGAVPAADAGPTPVSAPIVIGTGPCDPNLTYTWTPTQGLSDPNTCMPLASPASDTTYCLVVSENLSGCASAPSCVDVQACLPLPGRIGDLTAVAVSGVDVSFDWSDEAQARGGYHIYRISTKGEIPSASTLGTRVVTTPAGVQSSQGTLLGEVPGAGGTTYFYQLVGVCLNGTEGAF